MFIGTLDTWHFSICRDYYLTSAGWIGKNNAEVAAVWMNRAQNLSIVSACLAPNWTCIEVWNAH